VSGGGECGSDDLYCAYLRSLPRHAGAPQKVVNHVKCGQDEQVEEEEACIEVGWRQQSGKVACDIAQVNKDKEMSHTCAATP
jgi:hypothetical protein